MINANDIRCGNYFKVPPIYENEKEHTIQWGEKDWVELDKGLFSLVDIEPVEISPEVLEKCPKIIKFEKYWALMWGTNGAEIIVWDDYYKAFKLELGKGKYKVLDYLHNFMNLIFALTGEELEVKL